MRISVVLAVGLAALSACKGKPTNNTKPATPGSAGSTESTGSNSMGALVPNKGSAVAPDIVLPHADGSPPIKTTAPITAAKMTSLSTLQFAGFLRDVKRADGYLEVHHTTDSRPRVMATVIIEPCSNIGGAGSASESGSGSAGSGSAGATGCTPMELDQWKAKTDQLKGSLAKELRGLPDTVFEVGETDLRGAKAIYTVQIGQRVDTDDQGHMLQASYSYAYDLYFNDGVNQLRVNAEYKDDPLKTQDDMTKLVPREDLEKTAKAFADIYSHSWQP